MDRPVKLEIMVGAGPKRRDSGTCREEGVRKEDWGLAGQSRGEFVGL